MAMQFTRNYDLLNMYASGASYWDATKSVANNWRLRNTGGGYQAGAMGWLSQAIAPFESPLKWRGYYSSASNLPYIVVGTNGTAFSYDDYTISTFSTTDYSDSGRLFTVANDNSTIDCTIYKTFLNSSGSEQTVREVGLIGHINSDSTSYGGDFLIARDVLATPIVVPANGYFKVPVTFTVNVPQNLIPHA